MLAEGARPHGWKQPLGLRHVCMTLSVHCPSLRFSQPPPPPTQHQHHHPRRRPFSSHSTRSISCHPDIPSRFAFSFLSYSPSFSFTATPSLHSPCDPLYLCFLAASNSLSFFNLPRLLDVPGILTATPPQDLASDFLVFLSSHSPRFSYLPPSQLLHLRYTTQHGRAHRPGRQPRC